jgi:hypothetical protein
VFATQAIHFTREFFAELVEEFMVQELLFERLQHPRLDLVTPDSQVITARALLTSTEACETPLLGVGTRPETSITPG